MEYYSHASYAYTPFVRTHEYLPIVRYMGGERQTYLDVL